MRASKMLVNLSHAWFLNYGLYGNRPYFRLSNLSKHPYRRHVGYVSSYSLRRSTFAASSAASSSADATEDATEAPAKEDDAKEAAEEGNRLSGREHKQEEEAKNNDVPLPQESAGARTEIICAH